MTREHKLALIVGFSLILLVGVLISDHLSRARQAKISPVGTSETLLADSSLPPAVDPLGALSGVVNQNPQPQTTGLPPAPEGGSPQLLAGEQAAPADPLRQQPTLYPREDGVTMIVQSPNPQPTTPAPSIDPGLTELVERSGGQIVTGPDGTPELVLPPAAGAMTVSRTNGTSTLGDRPKVHAAPEPAAETAKVHAVQRGETLFQISSRYYGTGHLWRELAKHNGVSSKEGVVRVGDKLKIPSKEVLLGRSAPAGRGAAPAAQPSPRQQEPATRPRTELATYTVKKGDTLGEISLKVLGTSRRWQEIAKLNKIDDEDSITAGMVLKVPAMRG